MIKKAYEVPRVINHQCKIKPQDVLPYTHQNGQQRNGGGAVEMAQLMKYLLLQQEDLHFIPYHLYENPDVVAHACNLSAWEANIQRSLNR